MELSIASNGSENCSVTEKNCTHLSSLGSRVEYSGPGRAGRRAVRAVGSRRRDTYLHSPVADLWQAMGRL